MLHIQSFTFNPFQENTFVIYDQSGSAAIIDPGCFNSAERRQLEQYVEEKGLMVELLLNTHGHVDHMFGNRWVKDRWQPEFVTHRIVQDELRMAPASGRLFGVEPDPSPDPDRFVEEGDTIKLGESELEVLFTPGHSPGHISFLHRESENLFSGDVLFQGSIGRTDLPGGNYEELMETIVKKLLPLGDDIVVRCGHGPATTIGHERQTNPFVLQYLDGGTWA